MSLARKIITVGTGTALAQAIGAASTPVLTRAFAPEAHAAWAIFLSISAIFSALATLRFELAVVLPSDRSVSATLLLNGLIAAVVASVLAGIVLRFTGNLILPHELMGHLTLWCWLIPVSIFSGALYQLAIAWCTREAAFKMYSSAQFILPVGILVVQLAFAACGTRDAIGLIAGTVCGQAVVSFGLGLMLWRKNHEVFREIANFPTFRAAASAFRKYPCYMTPYTLVGLTRERLAYFLLGRLGTVQSAGYYGLVARLVNIPNSFVASAIRPVFFQHSVGRDPRSLEILMLYTIRTLGLIGVLLWAPCVVHAEWLFGFIFGKAWIPAAPYAIALSFPAIPLLMGNWADRTFDVLGRQRTALVMEMVFSTLAMIGLLGGYAIFKNLLLAIVVQSGLLAVYYFTWLILLFHFAGFRVAGIIRSIGEVLLLAGVAWTVCHEVALALPPPLAFALTILVSGGFATWLGWRSWRHLVVNRPKR